MPEANQHYPMLAEFEEWAERERRNAQRRMRAAFDKKRAERPFNEYAINRRIEEARNRATHMGNVLLAIREWRSA
jgi:hypothetical protein